MDSRQPGQNSLAPLQRLVARPCEGIHRSVWRRQRGLEKYFRGSRKRRRGGVLPRGTRRQPFFRARDRRAVSEEFSPQASRLIFGRSETAVTVGFNRTAARSGSDSPVSGPLSILSLASFQQKEPVSPVPSTGE